VSRMPSLAEGVRAPWFRTVVSRGSAGEQHRTSEATRGRPPCPFEGRLPYKCLSFRGRASIRFGIEHRRVLESSSLRSPTSSTFVLRQFEPGPWHLEPSEPPEAGVPPRCRRARSSLEPRDTCHLSPLNSSPPSHRYTSFVYLARWESNVLAATSQTSVGPSLQRPSRRDEHSIPSTFNHTRLPTTAPCAPSGRSDSGWGGSV
jgi:hypothetical protein